MSERRCPSLARLRGLAAGEVGSPWRLGALLSPTSQAAQSNLDLQHQPRPWRGHSHG